jgi:hypothetical protein
VPGAPAVTIGGRAVHGWNPAAYAELLGVTYKAPTQLSPKELAARLDRILESAGRLLAQVPDDKIMWTPPERNRTLRQLGYHVFRLSLAFVDAMDRGEMPKAWLDELAPAELATGPAISRYGELVRARLSGWFAGVGPDEFGRMLQIYYGPQSGHDLLERTTWHAAQHLRQLYVLAERIGLKPRDPMPADQFQGLPLPDALW